MRFLFVFILISIAIWCSCGDDKPTSYIGEPYTVNYFDEANKMALYYSGELYPPEHLVRQFDEELTLIRRTWGDSIPIVNYGFILPWVMGTLFMEFDDTAFATLENGVNPAWEELNDKLGTNYFILFGGSDGPIPNWVGVKAVGYIHQIRLGEYFVGFPGIKHIEGSFYPIPYAGYFVRSQIDNQVNYYFKDYCHYEIYFTYYKFRVINNKALLVGRFTECFDNFDSLMQVLPWDSFDILYENYRDSAETHKPAWVDTARAYFRSLEFSEPFSWSCGD